MFCNGGLSIGAGGGGGGVVVGEGGTYPGFPRFLLFTLVAKHIILPSCAEARRNEEKHPAKNAFPPCFELC